MGRPGRASWNVGGAAGGGGFNFQARVTAYIYSHVLAGRPMNFAANWSPVPLAVWAESGGPGDDLRVECEDGSVLEIQVKRGLRVGENFWGAVTKLIRGLADEPNLLGVLLVDPTTSGTIREDFQRGVKRLADGRTDDLDKITNELPVKLEEAGVDIDRSALQRFTVAVRDFSDNSTDRDNALLVLERVAEDPPAAWVALDSDAHDLIENRDRREAEDLARVLATKGGGVSRQAEQPTIAAHAYRDWLSETTSRFRVPGVAVSLPIEAAWSDLEAWDESGTVDNSFGQTLEERLTSYREWSRLGLRDGFGRTDSTFSADELPMAGDRLVVVAGPGAGKSTLNKRLAHRLSNSGKNVAHVRLPQVAERMEDGATFGEAVLDLAAANSGLRRDALGALLEFPDYLLADGLDECGASRGRIVEGLTGWAAGRQRSLAVVFTRPVGYDAALLPGWRHLELLPFDEDGARAHAGNLLRELRSDYDMGQDNLDAFMRSIKENETAKRAAGNPLLLGFLVRLYADRAPFGRRRAELYGQIVRRIRDQDPRHSSGEGLLAPTVDRALDILAWHLQKETLISGEEASHRLAQALEGELDLPPLKASEKAEE